MEPEKMIEVKKQVRVALLAAYKDQPVSTKVNDKPSKVQFFFKKLHF